MDDELDFGIDQVSERFDFDPISDESDVEKEDERKNTGPLFDPIYDESDNEEEDQRSNSILIKYLMKTMKKKK